MTAEPMSWWRTVLVGDRGEIRARPNAGSETYIVLPNQTRPRFVVDSSSSIGIADIVKRACAQRGLPRSIASAIVATRAVRLAPSRWSVSADPGAESLREHLSAIVGADLTLSIAVGPARVNRKPVVRCYDDDRLTAVAKLGPDSRTSGMVDNEAHWLALLEEEPIDGLITPTLRHHGRYGAAALIVMSALPVEADGGVAFDRMPDELLDRFTARYRADIPLAASSWFMGLPDRCAGLDDEIVPSALEVFGRPGITGLDFEAWHGDWSPWNLGRTDAGEWCLWDWERAAIDVPRGFDQVHRQVHYGAGLDAGRTALASRGLSEEAIDVTVGLYLLEFAARMIEGGAWENNDENPLRRELAAVVARVEASVGGER